MALSAIEGGEGGPRRESGGEGEVGSAPNFLIGRPHPSLSPGPAGERVKSRATGRDSRRRQNTYTPGRRLALALAG